MPEELEANGTEAIYADITSKEAAIKEQFNLTAGTQGAALPDAIIKKHKLPSEYDFKFC